LLISPTFSGHRKNASIFVFHIKRLVSDSFCSFGFLCQQISLQVLELVWTTVKAWSLFLKLVPIMFRKTKSTKQEEHEEEQEGEDLTTVQTLQPNRIIYVVPHTSFTKIINILDLTGLVKSQYPSEQFESETKKIATTSPPQPWLSITRNSRWFGKNFIVEQLGEQNGEIAQWKGGRVSTSSNTFTFPAESPHSSHPIKMEVDNVWKFREQFVKDSVTYQWKPDNVFSARKFTMYKILGNQRQVVARYWQGWQVKQGGTLVINAQEIDEVVAVLTMVSILRKKRQKAAEHSGGGGGGG
jgi:hypothetical protein